MAEEENLEQKVLQWLAREGYRLEYLTQEAFRDAGVRTTMSHYIESPDGKFREIDVSAFQDASTESSVIMLRALCECKYSMDKPWVLMLSGLSSSLFADWHSIPKSKPLQELSSKIGGFEKTLEGSWHFAKDQPFAHNLIQAFREKNRDAAFDSLQKISSAAWDCVETPERRGFLAYLVAIPCLVVEAQLFASRFDSKENKFLVKKDSIWQALLGGLSRRYGCRCYPHFGSQRVRASNQNYLLQNNISYLPDVPAIPAGA